MSTELRTRVWARGMVVVALAVISLAACHVRGRRGTSELELRWTVEGDVGRGVCQARGIDRFRASVLGPTATSLTVPCAEGWTMAFFDLVAGAHTVRLVALDAEGEALATVEGEVLVDPFERAVVALDLPARAFDGGGSSAGLTDLEVYWTIDGATQAKACATTGVASFLIKIAGPDAAEDRATCGERWDSGSALYGLKPGDYEVTVIAEDEDGAALGERGTKVALAAERGTIWTVDVDFDGAELKAPKPPAPSEGTLEVRWTVNGTVDGSAGGPSWDRCDEVGAVKVAVSIDGQPAETLPCGADEEAMQVALDGLATGARTVSVVLLDGAGEPLTTAATGEVMVSSKAGASRFVADFYFDAFFEPNKTGVTGDYLFKLTLGGKGCGDAGAESLTAQLARADKPLTPAPLVCEASLPVGATSGCFVADGSTTAGCLPGGKAGRIAGLTWGIYRLTVTADQGGQACWQTVDAKQPDLTSVEILVGAGEENPVVTHDLSPLSACVP